MAHLWNLIVESHTLNFLVLAIILLFAFKKINLPEMISKLQQNIENDVNESNLAKSKSQEALKIAEEKMANVDKEVETIIEDTQKTAQIISKNIVSQADEQIKTIKNNASKVIENETNRTKKILSDITVKTSVKLLRKNLENKLKEDKNLHQIFIDEAITELEGLNI